MKAVALHRRQSDEKLANQLAAFGLLGRTNISPSISPKPVPISSAPAPMEVHRRGYCVGSMPTFDLPPFHPINVQGLGFRGWVFQREPGRVRFIPVRPNGPAAKKSGGTGVFLPHPLVKEEVNKRNNLKGRDQRKPHQPQKVAPNFSPTHELVRPTFQPSSAELASLLPQEWSY